MSACLREKRSTFPPTQSHDSTEPAPGVGLRERKSDGEKALFQRKRERRGDVQGEGREQEKPNNRDTMRERERKHERMFLYPLLVSVTFLLLAGVEAVI